MLKFGKFAVVVIKVEEFLSKIIQGDPFLQYSIIKYDDFNEISSKAIFNPIVHKNDKFKHQKEFRIYSTRVFASKANSQELEQCYNVPGFKVINENYYISKIDNISTFCTAILPTQQLVDGYPIELFKNVDFCNKKRLDMSNRHSWQKNGGNQYETLISLK